MKKEKHQNIGYKCQYSVHPEHAMMNVPKFRQEAHETGLVLKLLPLMNQLPFGIMDISIMNEDSEEIGMFDYYIAVSSDLPLIEGMEELIIKDYKWAIFEAIGPMPNALQDVQKRIIQEWLPSSTYQYADGPDIELYGDGDSTSVDYYCEAWLPIMKNS